MPPFSPAQRKTNTRNSGSDVGAWSTTIRLRKADVGRCFRIVNKCKDLKTVGYSSHSQQPDTAYAEVTESVTVVGLRLTR
jgi:hypothetical protein